MINQGLFTAESLSINITISKHMTTAAYSVDCHINSDNLKLNGQSVAILERDGKMYISLLSLLDIYNQSCFYSLDSISDLLDYVESGDVIKQGKDFYLPDHSVIWLFNQLENVSMAKVIFKVVQRLKVNFLNKKALERQLKSFTSIRCFV